MLELVSDFQGLLDLEKPWNQLAADNPMLRHECSVACAQNPRRSERLAVHVLKSGGEVVAIAPFRAIRRTGIERYDLLNRAMWEPNGLLFRDEDALRALWDGLLRGSRSLAMGRFLADGPELRVLRDRLKESHATQMAPRVDVAAWLPLPSDPEELDRRMPRTRRTNMRQRRRSAERRGAVEFSCHCPGEAEAAPLLREAFRVEAAGWKGRNGTAILVRKGSEDFFTRYFTALARLGKLRLYFLRIAGETAAMRCAVEHANRLWDLKIGYDERFHDCSPGILLTHWTLQNCCERGLEAFEFMGEYEPWEDIWDPLKRNYASVTLHPLSVMGVASLAQEVTWRFTKQALAALKLDKAAAKLRAQRARAATVAASSP
jgi:CelD/BcsL family acetyltransferase involved in cellulose biosynthesis